MSKQIDEKVVSMEFDNKRFEENVKTSINTIGNLKKSLNFDSAAKSFESINEASKNVKFDSIASGVESLQSRFSTFGIVGMRVIENITDSMIRLSKKAMSFITEGIIQGGKKRAMNLENAHFQLQGLLKDEEAVSAVMKNVNDSVDGTAYSLDSAAKVAAQLAASGMRAGDQMFSSLRAVAGVAAMTSSEYDDIGRIFTKVSGQGRLMGDDLLSLSSRGMNAAATLGNYLHKTEAEVRDMVSKGKIDFATFSAAMDDAYGEHAKKANETLIGSLSNVKAALARIGAAFFTPLVKQNGVLVNLLNTIRERVNDVKAEVGPFADLFVNSVSKIAEKSNEFLKNLKVTNYVKSIYNSILAIKNLFNGLLTLLNPIGKAFREVFSPIDSSTLLQYSERLIDLTSKFKLSDEAAEKLRSTFNSFFSVCKSVINALKTLTERVYSSFSGVSTFDDMFLSLLSTVEKVGTKLGTFFVHIIDKIREGGPSLTKILDTITTSIKNFGKNVFNFLGDSRVVEGGVLVALVYWLRKLLYTIQGTISRIKNLTSVGDAVNKFLVQLSDTLFQMENQIRYDALMKMASGILILAIAIKLLSSIDTTSLTKSLGAVIALMYSLVKAMDSIAPKLKSFSKNGGSLKNLLSSFAETKMITTLTNSLLKFSVAILILSFAVKNLSSLDLAGLFKGLFGIGAIFLELAGFLKLMEKIDSKNFATKLIPFSVGILILSYALEKLGKLSWEEIRRGLSAMGGALTELVAVTALLGKYAKGSSLAGAVSILIISLSLNKIYDALKNFGSMSWKEIRRSLSAMGGALAELAVVTGLLGEFGGLSSIAGAVSILIVAKYLNKIYDALKNFGSMSWKEIGRGLSAMGGALAELALVTGLLGNFGGFGGLGAILGAVSILIIAKSLNKIYDALKNFGSMSWGEIRRGLSAMGGALAELAVVTGLLGNFGGLGAIVGAVSILIVAKSLKFIGESLSVIGRLSWGEIIRGLIGMKRALNKLAVVTGLLGNLGGLGAIVGSKAISLAAKSLIDLAYALKEFSGMSWDEIGRGLTAMGSALGEVALGSLINTLSGLGSKAISEVAAPLGTLADSIVKWKDVTVPEGLGKQMSTLASAIRKFIFTGSGSKSIAKVAEPLGTLADSVAKWSGVTIPFGIGAQLVDLANGVYAFSATFAGGWSISQINEPFSKLADSVAKWKDVTIPFGIGAQLVDLANGVYAFSATFAGGWSISQINGSLGELADSVSKWSGVTVPKGLGEQMSTLASAISEFIFTGLGSKSISEVAEPMGALADSVLKWAGLTVPEGLGKQMSTLASAISEFIFTGLGSKSIAEVAEPMGILADSVSKWSMVTIPFGIGAQLVDLANGVYAFSATFVGGWSISQINEPLSNLADTIAKWKDVTIPFGIGAQLVDLANGVYAFSATFVGGWSISQINEPLSNLADTIVKWSGVTVPENFKDNLERIVESIKQFSLLDAVKIAAIDKPLNNLSVAFQNFSSITGTGENLVIFATNIKTSGDKVSDIDSEAINSASNMINKFMNVIKKVNSIDTNNISSFVNAANELNNIKIDSIQIDSNNLSSVISSIKKAMGSISKAISSSKTSIDSATKTAVSGCAGVVREKIASMESAGKDLGIGLIRGINSKKQEVYDAGFALGQSAVQGEKKGQKSNSPSKLTIKAGQWLGEGLVIGIQKMGNSVYQSGYNLGETATNAISSTISRIADVLDSDIDTQPTIRPVLDLSDVSAGAGTINRMFGANPSIGVLAKVNSISSMMNSQNGSNKEVISAIKDLGNKLDNKSGDTYNFGDFTYDDSSNVSDAVRTLVRAVTIEGRK